MEQTKQVNETANVRKLATIARILKIDSIEGSDNLELATVRGWHVVVKKGEFHVGSLCVYVEVDAVMPDGLDEPLQVVWKETYKKLSKAKTEEEKAEIKSKLETISAQNTRPEFEFLRDKKFRIKTREIFGQISQGICFPLSILPQELQWHIDELVASTLISTLSVLGQVDSPEGIDVTNALGIVQYVAPENTSLDGIAIGELAQVGILVSDEERIENLADRYEELKKRVYIESEKLEGTSIACYLKNDEFGVCGRNINFKRPEEGERVNSYWFTAMNLQVEMKMRSYAETHRIKNFAIQGELIGDGIQGNIYKLKNKTIAFYNAFNIDTSQYVPYEEFLDMISEMELHTVPILNMNRTLPDTVDELLLEVDHATTVIGNNPEQLAEGRVYVAKGDVMNARIQRSPFGRLSFKAKSRPYDKKKN
jgi:RNA ligase (TIGR02306 family)